MSMAIYNLLYKWRPNSWGLTLNHPDPRENDLLETTYIDECTKGVYKTMKHYSFHRLT